MKSTYTRIGLVALGVVSCVILAAGITIGFHPRFFDHRLVGLSVLPAFNPNEVVKIELNGSTILSRASGQWRIVPFGGYPANSELIKSTLHDVAQMTVRSVVRDAKLKCLAMERCHKVTFADDNDTVLGEIVLGNEHIEHHSGFVESVNIPDGRYLELEGEVVLVKEILHPLTMSPVIWCVEPISMIPRNLYFANIKDIMAPVVSIDYSFNGCRFKMRRGDDGALKVTDDFGNDALLGPKPFYLVDLPFVDRIEPASGFLERHGGSRMESGTLTVCTTDGTNVFCRTAALHRGQDETGYVQLGDWVFIIARWNAKNIFVSRDDIIKRRQCLERGVSW